MKYDDASWHYGGDFPDDLPPEAGATHIGMFVSWCLLNGLAGDLHLEESPATLTKLQNREMTPGAWFISACDEKFTDEDLSDEGNDFAKAYFSHESGNYIRDYDSVLKGSLKSSYHVSDTWMNYDKLSPIISKRYWSWKHPKRWWEFWK